MKKNSSFVRIFLFLIPLILAFKIFLPIFTLPEINSGDWPYFGKGMFDAFSIVAPLWTNQFGGLGGVNPDFPLYTYLNFTIGLFVNTLHIPWVIVYKIFWFGLPLLLGFISISNLYKSVKKDYFLWELTLSYFIFVCNTYFLLIFSGGQMGIALAYSLSPLVFSQVYTFLKKDINSLSKKIFFKGAFLFGLLLGLEVFFDSRIAFLTTGVILLYFSFHSFFVKKISILRSFAFWSVSLLSTIFLHLYWIVPFYLFKLLLLPEGITSSSAFSFFSFADFSHAFSFLHPNWPENIFGKIYFLQPEFLILPILAYASLLFVAQKKEQKKENIYILFFVLLGILGTFFAKGVNGPFGFINSFLFGFPGFNLFRDSTKYYLFIALSYSILIPFTTRKIYDLLEAKKTNLFNPRFSKTAFVLLVVFFLAWTVRPSIFGHLGGTFKYVAIPKDYKDLYSFILNQKKFSRTLWVPDPSPFRFISENHPLLTSDIVFGSNEIKTIIKSLNKPGEEDWLESLGVKYIIVPSDKSMQIFLTDRKYDDKKRRSFIKQLDNVLWLKKSNFGEIVVYEIPNPKDHFYFSDGTAVSYKRLSSSSYLLKVSLKSQKTLTFAESFHPGWVVKTGDIVIKSNQTKNRLNSFVLKPGNYELNVIFLPQEYQNYFYLISGLSLLGIVLFLILA